jgi:hypothetical protein
MRTTAPLSIVVIFVAALLVCFTDLAQSQDVQTFGQGGPVTALWKRQAGKPICCLRQRCVGLR